MVSKTTSQKEAKVILLELEDIWKKFDTVYNSLSDEDWNKKFGKDWVFADQPYHLAFFDRMVAQSLLDGSKNTNRKKLHLKTMEHINKWNEQEFKKRPKKYTPQQSLNDFRKSHELLRKTVEKQKSWEEKVWLPLFFGWVPALDSLASSL